MKVEGATVTIPLEEWDKVNSTIKFLESRSSALAKIEEVARSVLAENAQSVSLPPDMAITDKDRTEVDKVSSYWNRGRCHLSAMIQKVVTDSHHEVYKL